MIGAIVNLIRTYGTQVAVAGGATVAIDQMKKADIEQLESKMEEIMFQPEGNVKRVFPSNVGTDELYVANHDDGSVQTRKLPQTGKEAPLLYNSWLDRLTSGNSLLALAIAAAVCIAIVYYFKDSLTDFWGKLKNYFNGAVSSFRRFVNTSSVIKRDIDDDRVVSYTTEELRNYLEDKELFEKEFGVSMEKIVQLGIALKSLDVERAAKIEQILQDASYLKKRGAGNSVRLLSY